VRKIDVCPTAVYWSDTGDKVALVTEKTFYVLQYNKDLVNAVLDAGATPSAEGIDDAFEVVHEIGESVDTALWIGDW
jgi:coatomer subunit beta'